MKWHSEYDSIIHIISKKDGTPHPLSKKVRAKGFISFHHSNAYEKDGHIVLDVTASWKQENKGLLNLRIVFEHSHFKSRLHCGTIEIERTHDRLVERKS